MEVKVHKIPAINMMACLEEFNEIIKIEVCYRLGKRNGNKVRKREKTRYKKKIKEFSWLVEIQQISIHG
jgi:hypothetical protein